MGTGYNSPADQRAKRLEVNPEEERELRQLVDAVPQHIVVLAAGGRRLHANQVVLDYHGLTLEEFLAEVTPTKCVHPEDLERYLNLRQSGIKSGAPWEAEIRLRKKDGQSRWFLIPDCRCSADLAAIVYQKSAVPEAIASRLLQTWRNQRVAPGWHT